jgi:hypothetical protein
MEDKQITANFTLHAFLFAGSDELQRYNKRNLHEVNYDNAIATIEFLQGIRNEINLEFGHRNNGKQITLVITSGFRCVAWEYAQKRSGKGQHPKCNAADVQPSNCSPELAVEILEWLEKKYWCREKGHKGGFAIKKPTYRSNKLIKVGFAHFDKRPEVARWYY